MDFFTWLDKEMDRRKLDDAALARRGKFSPPALSMIRSGKRRLTFPFCVKVARGLGLEPEIVFRKAGLLPTPPGEDLRTSELLAVVRQMSDEELRDVEDYAWFRLRKRSSR